MRGEALIRDAKRGNEMPTWGTPVPLCGILARRALMNTLALSACISIFVFSSTCSAVSVSVVSLVSTHYCVHSLAGPTARCPCAYVCVFTCDLGRPPSGAFFCGSCVVGTTQPPVFARGKRSTHQQPISYYSHLRLEINWI